MHRAARGTPKSAAVVVLMGLLGSLLAVGWLTPAPAANADFKPHAGLVPEIPAGGYPAILKTPMLVEDGTPNYNKPESREVMAANQVGRAIVSGGNFQEIELQDGTVIQQSYFAAWNIDTKQMMCQQKFVFNNDVLAIAPGPRAGTAYVGGRFTKITDASGITRNRVRLAMINLDTCTVEVGFNAGGINSKVNDIVFGADRLFIGGDFTAVGGQAIETIAELDPSTGAVNPAFNFVTSGEIVTRIQAMGLNTDGTRLVIAGRWGTMTRGGVSVLNPTAVINISNPAAPILTGHRSSGTVQIKDLQDASVAPDGSTVGLVFGTATVSDYVYLYPTTEASVTYRWRHFMRDSSFGVGISNNAMYVAGHFCKPDAGPGASDVMAPQMGLSDCTGTRNYSGGVWRSHLAALSLTDGTPLPWNPGQGSHTGGTEITVTTRGLLVGYDGERTADRKVGALAFFDFGAGVEDVTPPGPVTFTSPTAGQALNNPALLTGRADDDFGVASYKVAVRAADGRWVQADGSLGADRRDITVAPEQDGSFELSLNMPAGNYTAYARALDAAGLRSAVDTSVSFVETGIEGIRPESSVVVPAGTLLTETSLSITGKATDNVAVSSVVARITTPAGKYVRADGTIGNAPADLSVNITAGALNSPSATWSLDVPKTLPANKYTVEIITEDPSGNVATSPGSFDLKPNAPVVATSGPVSPAVQEEPFVVAGTATDDTKVVSIKVQVKNAAGDFLRTDGTFGAAQDLPATVTGLGTASASFQYNAGLLPIGDYQVLATATDGVGNATTTTTDVKVTDVLETKTALLTSYTGFSALSGNYSQGFSFKVAQPTTVSAVGMFDTDKNGVYSNPGDTPFGIWIVGNSTPIAQGVIPKAAASENGWFYGDLPTRLALQPGATYLVGVMTYTNGEKYGSGGTVVNDPNLTMVQTAWTSSTTLTYPTPRSTTWTGVPNLKTVTTVSTKPAVTVTSPKASILNEESFTISGTATDNSQVSSLSVQVTNAAGSYLRSDGTFGAAQDLPVTVSGLGTTSAAFQYNAGLLPLGDYQVTATVKDGAGNTTSTTRDVKVTDVSETTAPLLSNYAGFTQSSGNYTIGYTFRVSEQTKVTSVGLYDTDKDGVNDNATDVPFGIWRDGNTTLVAQGTIPRAAAAESGWFYGALSAPLTLEPNVTYVVGVLHSSAGEKYGSGGTPTKDAKLTMVASAYASGTSLAYPSTRAGTTWYGVPNLKTVSGVSAKPQVAMSNPPAEVTFGQGVTIDAAATDNISVASVKARLTNAAGDYLQDDGSFASAVNDLDASVTGAGTAAAKVNFTTQPLPVGSYTATVIAADSVNNTGIASRSFAVVVPPAVIPAIKSHTGFTQSAGDYSLGYQFRVTRTATLSDVGIQDANGDGILNNTVDTQFSVWRQSDRAVMATGTVAKASSAQAGWFYGKLAAPVTLQPGVTYVVAYRAYAAGEKYTSAGTLSQDGIFQYVGYAYGSTGTVMPYPTSQGTSPIGYGMPNLRFANPSPPVLLKPADQSSERGVAASLQLTGVDPDGGSVTYSSSALPAGLSLNVSTGVISGTPTANGTTMITVTVTDDEGVSATTAFSWTVTSPPIVTPDCVVTPNAGGGVLVDWVPVDGIAQYNVRSNNTFVAAVASPDSQYVHTAGSAANQYLIRYRSGGVNVDLTCVNG